MTDLSLRLLQEFLNESPHDDIADVGGVGACEATRYDLDLGHDICVGPLPRKHSTIVCMDVFEHLVDPVRAAEHLVASLNPGGLIFLTTVFTWPIHHFPIDMYRFTTQALGWLFRDLEILRLWQVTDSDGERVSIIARKHGEPVAVGEPFKDSPLGMGS